MKKTVTCTNATNGAIDGLNDPMADANECVFTAEMSFNKPRFWLRPSTNPRGGRRYWVAVAPRIRSVSVA